MAVEDLAFRVTAEDDASATLSRIGETSRRSALQIEGAQLKVEKATNAVAVAQRRYGEDSLQARTATNQLAQAQLRLADAERSAVAGSRGLNAETAATGRALGAVGTSGQRAGKALKETEEGTRRAGRGFSALRVAADTAAASAGIAVVEFARSSVDAYKDADEKQRQLEEAYRRFPAVASVNIDSLRELDSALERKTKFDDDATAAAQAQLAQFRLTGEQIVQLTPLLQDYAARTGKDLPAAADALGRAILGQGRGLKTIGIQFKDTGSETGNFTELMAGLRAQVGGFAESEGKSATGQAEILSNEFGELQEQLGSELLPALLHTGRALLDVTEFLQENSRVVKPLAITLGSLAAAVLAINTATKLTTATQTAANTVMGLIARTVGTTAAAETEAAAAAERMAAAQQTAAAAGVELAASQTAVAEASAAAAAAGGAASARGGAGKAATTVGAGQLALDLGQAGESAAAGEAKAAAGAAQVAKAAEGASTRTARLTSSLGVLAGAAGKAGVAGVTAYAGINLLQKGVDAVGRARTPAADTDKLANSLKSLGTTGSLGAEGLRLLGTAAGDGRTNLQATSQAVHEFGEEAKAALTGGAAQGIRNFFTQSGQDAAEFRTQVKQIDTALASLVGSGNTDAAAASFAALEASAQKQGVPIAKLREQFPQYAAALGQAAGSNDTSTGAIDRNTLALTGQTTAVQRAAKAAQDLLETRSNRRDLEGAIDDLSNSLKQNGKSFDVNTEKGRANQAALDALVGTYDKLGSDQKTPATLSRVAKAMTDAQIAAGKSRAAAEALTAKLLGIPNREIKLAGNIADLDQKIRDGKAHLKTVPDSKRAALLLDIQQWEAARKKAQRDLNGVHGKTVTLRLRLVEETYGPGSSRSQAPQLKPSAVLSAIAKKNSADGGLLTARAAGGLLPGALLAPQPAMPAQAGPATRLAAGGAVPGPAPATRVGRSEPSSRATAGSVGTSLPVAAGPMPALAVGGLGIGRQSAGAAPNLHLAGLGVGATRALAAGGPVTGTRTLVAPSSPVLGLQGPLVGASAPVVGAQGSVQRAARTLAAGGLAGDIRTPAGRGTPGARGAASGGDLGRLSERDRVTLASERLERLATGGRIERYDRETSRDSSTATATRDASSLVLDRATLDRFVAGGTVEQYTDRSSVERFQAGGQLVERDRVRTATERLERLAYGGPVPGLAPAAAGPAGQPGNAVLLAAGEGVPGPAGAPGLPGHPGSAGARGASGGGTAPASASRTEREAMVLDRTRETTRLEVGGLVERDRLIDRADSSSVTSTMGTSSAVTSASSSSTHRLSEWLVENVARFAEGGRVTDRLVEHLTDRASSATSDSVTAMALRDSRYVEGGQLVDRLTESSRDRSSTSTSTTSAVERHADGGTVRDVQRLTSQLVERIGATTSSASSASTVQRRSTDRTVQLVAGGAALLPARPEAKPASVARVQQATEAVRRAGGGDVPPGTIAMVSGGEWLMAPGPTSRNRALLEDINAGRRGFASGGGLPSGMVPKSLGGPRQDNVPVGDWAAGYYVVNARQTEKHQALLAAISQGAVGRADGGSLGGAAVAHRVELGAVNLKGSVPALAGGGPAVARLVAGERANQTTTTSITHHRPVNINGPITVQAERPEEFVDWARTTAAYE